MPEDGKNELHLVPYCVVEFYVGVTRCPDAAVTGGLNNRGHDDWPEITCWPKKTYHARTSGKEFKGLGFSPEMPQLNTQEKEMCAILGLKEWELGVFLKDWQHINHKDKYPKTAAEVAEKLHEVRPRPQKKLRLMVTTLAGFKREHGL